MEQDSQHRVNSDASSHLCFFAQGSNTGAYKRGSSSIGNHEGELNTDLEGRDFIMLVLSIPIPAYSPAPPKNLFIYRMIKGYNVEPRRLGARGEFYITTGHE